MISRLLQPLHRSTLVRASAHSVGAAFGAQLLLLASGPLVARMLGVENRGYLAALYAFGTIAAWLGTLGVPTACSFYVATQRPRARSIAFAGLRLLLVQALIATAVLAVVLVAWARGKSVEFDALLIAMLFLPPASLAHAYALGLLQGLQRFLAHNALALLPVFLYAGGMIALFVAGESRLHVVVAVWIGSMVVSALVSLGVALTSLPSATSSEPVRSRELLNFGLRAHLGHASPVSTLPLDQAAVGAFLTPAALGLYAVATGFTNLLRFTAESVGRVAYPAVAVRGHTPEGWRILWRFVLVVFALTAVLAAVLVAAAPTLIVLLFGASFAGAAPTARLLVVAVAFSSTRGIVLEGLRGVGRPGAATLAEVAMYPWLVVAAPIALLKFGGTALAGALAIGYGISLAVSLVIAIRLDVRLTDRRQPPPVSAPVPLAEVARGPGP
jgi:O-antigen/teichoic acid export membrane protein